MRLDQVRLPGRGLPGEGTGITGMRAAGAVNFREEDLAEGAIDDGEGDVLIFPEEATAMLTLSNGQRIERRITAIAIRGRRGTD